jgi:hypothetical protein
MADRESPGLMTGIAVSAILNGQIPPGQINRLVQDRGFEL